MVNEKFGISLEIELSSEEIELLKNIDWMEIPSQSSNAIDALIYEEVVAEGNHGYFLTKIGKEIIKQIKI